MSTEQQQLPEQVKSQTTLTNVPNLAGFTSLGKCLQQARLRAGLTPLQIAQDLHLDVRMIEFIERDRFKELGAPVYAKGYLRRYAKVVGMDDMMLLGLYEALRDPPVAVDPIPVSLNSIPESRKLLPNWMLWALAGFLVIASVTAALNFVSTQLPTNTVIHTVNVAPVVEPSSFALTPVTKGTSESVTQTPHTQPLIMGSIAPVSSAGANETSYVTQSESSALPHIAGHVAMTLKFSGDSWVEIYDANNRQVMFDMGRSASSRQVEGVAPLRVVLGSAQQVALQIDGHGVTIPARRVTANVAHFKVSSNGSID